MAFNKQITARGEAFNAYWRVEETRIGRGVVVMVGASSRPCSSRKSWRTVHEEG